MNGSLQLIPIALWMLAYVGIVVFVIWLLLRIARAAERIAIALEQRR